MNILGAITQLIADPADREVPDVAGCPACPHALDTHDAVDLRFCRATASGGKTRGCTCAAR